jgi:hypothetical protein
LGVFANLKIRTKKASSDKFRSFSHGTRSRVLVLSTYQHLMMQRVASKLTLLKLITRQTPDIPAGAFIISYNTSRDPGRWEIGKNQIVDFARDRVPSSITVNNPVKYSSF